METSIHTQLCLQVGKYLLLISFCILSHQAELQEVVGEGETEEAETASCTSSATAESSQAATPESPQVQHMLHAACSCKSLHS